MDTTSFFKPIRKSDALRRKLDEYGIEHLSASSLNEYVSDPAKWVLRYILKVKTEGPGLWRGSSVEGALRLVSEHKTDIENAVQIGLGTFDQSELLFLEKRGGEVPIDEKYEEKRDSERELIEHAIRAGHSYFLGLNGAKFQTRIEFDLGIEIPAIGYVDFDLPEYILDTKTAKQFPSSYDLIKDRMKRQQALYSKALGKPAKLLYLGKPTKNKSHLGIKEFDINPLEVDGLVNDLRMAARSLRRLLMNTGSKEEIIEWVFPNYDAFEWNDEERKIAKEIWRLGAA